MLAGDEQDEMTITHAVTANYFSLLGVKAALGQASVEPIGGQPAAVLGHRLWQRRFSGDPEIVGEDHSAEPQAFCGSRCDARGVHASAGRSD